MALLVSTSNGGASKSDRADGAVDWDSYKTFVASAR